jgi:hypothetical protein
VTKTSIEIGSVPGRKSKAICVTEGCVCYPVAYFKNQEAYERFIAAVKGKWMVWVEDDETK